MADSDESMDLRTFCQLALPYKHCRWYHQIVVVLVGFTVWAVAYDFILATMGWEQFATGMSEEALSARRWAIAGAGAVYTTYFVLTAVFLLSGGFLICVYITLVPLAPEFYGVMFGPEPVFIITSLSQNPAAFISDAFVPTLGIVLSFTFWLVVFLIGYNILYWYDRDLATDLEIMYLEASRDATIRAYYRDDMTPEKFANMAPRVQTIVRDAGAAPDFPAREINNSDSDD